MKIANPYKTVTFGSLIEVATLDACSVKCWYYKAIYRHLQ